MGTTMTRSKLPNSFETFREAEGWVYQVVINHRNRGLKTPHAIEQAALDLGISPRKVRSFFHGEASLIAHEEWESLKSRFLAHLEAEATDLARRADAARRRRAQIELDLE